MNESEKNSPMTRAQKSSQNTEVTKEVPKRKKGSKLFKLIFLLVLAGLAYSQYELYQIKQADYQQKMIEKKNQNVLASVSKLMLLPDGQPQIYYVQDAEQLKKQQVFFKSAENGDAVLVYQTVAIVYSIAKNKIVNVGPVIGENENQTEKQQVIQTPVPKVEKATTTSKR